MNKFKLICRKNLLALAAFFVTLVITSFFSTIDVDFFHDGILLKPAIDVAQGKILFKDTFTHYGALTTYIQALAIKIFGPYLLVVKFTAALFYALTAFFLIKIWSRFLSPSLTFISFIFWLFLAPYSYNYFVFLPWASVYALFFQCLALNYLLRFIDTQKTAFIFWAGASSALAFWCKQPVGILLFLALISFLIYRSILTRQKFSASLYQLLILSFGFIFISLPLVIQIFMSGAASDWWIQSLLLAQKFGQVAGNNFNLLTIFQNLFIPPPSLRWLIWLFLPLSCLFLTTSRILKKQTTIKSTSIVAAGLVCLASWLQYYPIAELRHYYWAATPMFGFFIFSLKSIINSISKKFKINKFSYQLTESLTLAIFTAFFIIKIGGRFQTAVNDTNIYPDLPPIFYGIRLSPANADLYFTLTGILNNYFYHHPEKTYVNISADAFFSLQPHYHQFHQMNSILGEYNYMIYPNYQKKLIAYITNYRPVIIAQEYLPPLINYCRLDFDNYLGIFLLFPIDKTPPVDESCVLIQPS